MKVYSPPVVVEEVDGSPSIKALTKLIVPNGSLTQNGTEGTLAFPIAVDLSSPPPIGDVVPNSGAFSNLSLSINTETLAANKTLVTTDKIVQWLDPGGSSRDVILPAEADSANLRFRAYNDADAEGENLVYKNDGGATIATFGPGMMGDLACDGTDWKWEGDTGTFYDSISGDVKVGGGRVTFPGGTNDNGLVFASLGTANIMIDGQSSGMSGSSDYWLYLNANNYWRADGKLALVDATSSAKSLLLGTMGMYLSAGNFWHNNVGGSAFAFGLGATTHVSLFTNGATVPWIMEVAAGKCMMVGNRTPVGSITNGVSNGTATITDTGGAAHGLSLAPGDLAHITDVTTAADEGFYRVISDDGTNVVLDRALSGSDTDLDVTFYKDVIGMFSTDSTNGNRIMGYSHQGKPLQIGGDVLVATGHSLGSEDVLIGGKLEVDGDAYFDESIDIAGGKYLKSDGTVVAHIYSTGMIFDAAATIRMNDDLRISFGNSNDAKFLYETADANANEFILALPDGGATDVPILVIGDQGIVNVDLGWFNGQTIPRIAMVAADEGGYFAHGVDNSDILDILATTAPVAEVDETKFSHKLQIVINGVTYYVMLTQS